MSYRIAGIDVHKKMLAVVVSDVEIESEYQFERRMFGSSSEQLRTLAAWLLEKEAEEVVMESTAQYWKPVWEALERYWKPICEKREGAKRRSGASTGSVRTAWGHIRSPLIDMPKRSAGLLRFRRRDSNLQVFLVHPGGPFWKKKDFGAWSIPKGEYEDGLVVITVSDEPTEQQAKFTEFDRMTFVKGPIDPGSRVADLYISPEVARPIAHIIDRDGVLRETLIAGQSYESFERTMKP